jgi:broad specificity phosphatase PhoE
VKERTTPPVAELILVRHAATAWTGTRYCGRGDPPLTRAGRLAATRTATQLAATLDAGTRIVSSPARRALETATAIAVASGIGPVEVDPRWVEADVGVAEGRTFAELEQIAPDLARALADGGSDIDWPDGETAASLAERVTSAWQDLVGAGRDAVVVSHGGPIRIARALALGVPASTIGPVAPAGIVRVSAAAGR